MYSVNILFSSKESARHFMLWLDGQGEQSYFEYEELNGRSINNFVYDYTNQAVIVASRRVKEKV